MRWSSLVIFLLLVTVSCIEPFMPETRGYENVLFIEGRLTNDDQLSPYVLISRTTPIGEDPEFIDRQPVSGASVSVLCDDGTEYPFGESFDSRYIPLDADFKGEEGKAYRIRLSYAGNIFESDFEVLLPSPAIDSITAAPDMQKRYETSGLVHGLQFFISTHDDSSAPSYYRWVVDKTFKYEVPYNATHVMSAGGPVFGSNASVKFCYKNEDVRGIFISSTEGLVENAVVNAPLNFEDQYGDDLSLIYSLRARQLAISKETYEFWVNLDKLSNQTGGLYESQAFRLEGNIRCTTDPTVNVSGIFEVAGVSESRAYFSKPEEFEIVRLECGLEMVGRGLLSWDRIPVGTYLLEDDPDVFFTSDIECLDCRSRGGTNIQPYYWDEGNIKKE